MENTIHGSPYLNLQAQFTYNVQYHRTFPPALEKPSNVSVEYVDKASAHNEIFNDQLKFPLYEH